jgi:hypothetical protein
LTASTTRVYLETGAKCVFAVALEWPGWCRRAADADLAVAELERYRDRYARVVGRPFAPGPVEVIGTVPGTGTTDFGAPDARGPWDEPAPSGAELERQVGLLDKAWAYFDKVVSEAPEALRKGPRGGGRDRDAIVDHVREAERVYGRKVGIRVPPRTPWAEQRTMIADGLLEGPEGTAWPVGYAIRRFAWHILDHAWEIEDKSS